MTTAHIRLVSNVGFSFRTVVLAFQIACVVMASAGCGGPVRRAVAGGVMLDGQPLDEAVIVFVPLDAGGRKTGGGIAAGRYAVPQEWGLLPGRYRVEIVDDPPLDPAMRPGQGKSRPRRKTPVLYSTSSPLTIEVGAEGSTDFDFNLFSNPTPTP
jgi:hypothetical protein